MAIKVLIVGLGGHMGQVLADLLMQDERFELVAGLDAFATKRVYDLPLFKRAADLNVSYDVIIDFSNPAVLPELKELAKRDAKAMVIATTGYNDAEIAERDRLAELVPLFTSANMSLGVNLLARLAKDAARILYPAYDIEIIEAHHRRKLDAPSGTALFLAEQVRSALTDEIDFCYERASRRFARPQNEIGISAIRGGTIVGEHEIMFAGEDEVISLRHSAGSRKLFAAGAASAAAFVSTKAIGHYDMNDLLSEILDKG